MTNTCTLKPVYQRSSCGVEWAEITFDFYSRYAGADGFYYRILYHAAAYEAQRNEVERLQKELAQAKEESQNYENASRISHEWSMQIGLTNGELREANAAQAKRIEELEAATEHLGLTPKQAADGLARYQAQVTVIESLRKQVEILQKPLDDEIISRIICLVKNIPDEELASNVFESVRNMTNWNKSTPAEFLVLFDKTAASKNGE